MHPYEKKQLLGSTSWAMCWDERELKKLVHANNPTCLGWYMATRENNPRGHYPNNNPTPLEELCEWIHAQRLNCP
jgi:hypothetical protein